MHYVQRQLNRLIFMYKHNTAKLETHRLRALVGAEQTLAINRFTKHADGRRYFPFVRSASVSAKCVSSFAGTQATIIFMRVICNYRLFLIIYKCQAHPVIASVTAFVSFMSQLSNVLNRLI